MGDGIPDLVRLVPPINELTTPSWLATTDEARQQPRIRAEMDSVIELVQRTLAKRPVHQAADNAA